MRPPPTAVRPLLMLAGAAMLVACSSEPEPIFSDPPANSSTASLTTSATSEPPTATPAVDPRTETAEEFIRRFEAESFTMQESGDTTTFRSLTDGCGSCDSLADRVDKVYAKNRRIIVGRARVVDIVKVGKIETTSIFDFKLETGVSEIVKRDGTVVERFPGGSERFRINLRRQGGDGAWLVSEIAQVV